MIEFQRKERRPSSNSRAELQLDGRDKLGAEHCSPRNGSQQNQLQLGTRLEFPAARNAHELSQGLVIPIQALLLSHSFHKDILVWNG